MMWWLHALIRGHQWFSGYPGISPGEWTRFPAVGREDTKVFRRHSEEIWRALQREDTLVTQLDYDISTVVMAAQLLAYLPESAEMSLPRMIALADEAHQPPLRATLLVSLGISLGVCDDAGRSGLDDGGLLSDALESSEALIRAAGAVGLVFAHRSDTMKAPFDELRFALELAPLLKEGDFPFCQGQFAMLAAESAFWARAIDASVAKSLLLDTVERFQSAAPGVAFCAAQYVLCIQLSEMKDTPTNRALLDELPEHAREAMKPHMKLWPYWSKTIGARRSWWSRRLLNR